MSEGIKDKVAIIGMGCTKFGERWESSAEDLMVESFQECLEDAGIEKKDIDAAWQSNQTIQCNIGTSALPMSTTLKLPFIPVTHVENMCASGSEAFRAAVYAVASGASDVALALGVEKLKDIGTGGLPPAHDMIVFGTQGRIIYPSWDNTNPGMFAQMAIRYFERYGLSIEEGKKAMAKISVNRHHNGNLNPKEHLHRDI